MINAFMNKKDHHHDIRNGETEGCHCKNIGTKGNNVRLGIEAPKEIPIRRKELRELTVAHDLFVEVAEVA